MTEQQLNAMKLALEALEHCKDAIVERGLNGNPEFAKKWGLVLPLERSEKAITAIRSALAEDVPETNFGNITEQPAQQQEPVACIGYWNQKTGAFYKPDQLSSAHQKMIDEGILRRCYIASPQRKPWVGLTDEEIVQIELGLRQYNNRDTYDLSLKDFARAIEAAHGIKENT